MESVQSKGNCAVATESIGKYTGLSVIAFKYYWQEIYH